MKETNLVATAVPHEVIANAVAATTTQNYTTTACSCYVSGHNSTTNICTDLGGVVAAKIQMPAFSVVGCNGASFTGFKIIAVPGVGTLAVNGTTVVANQMLTKADWSAMIYTLGATQTKATTTFTYQVWASCGNSTTVTVTLNIDNCYPPTA